MQLLELEGSVMSTCRVSTVVFAALFFIPTYSSAETLDSALVKRMEDEKSARRGCKISICDIARNKKAEGPDVSCTVVKTWTSTELKERILRGKFEWPWSHAQCSATIALERKSLAQVLSGATIDVKLAKHSVSCSLDQKDGNGKYPLIFAITPNVTFKDGKAVKAALNWSEIDGAAVAKAAVWSTAALDNNLGVLESATVDVINDFFKEQCEEVKGEFQK